MPVLNERLMTVLYKNEDLYMKNVNICLFPAKRRSDGSCFFFVGASFPHGKICTQKCFVNTLKTLLQKVTECTSLQSETGLHLM